MRKWTEYGKSHDLPDAGEYVLVKISPPVRGSNIAVANLTQLVSGYFHWMTVHGVDIENKVTAWSYIEID